MGKRVIVEKPTNRTERYEVAETEFSGRKFLDIRTYYIKDGEWLPTKKGISVPVEMSGALYKAIRQVGKPYFDLVPPPGKEQEAEEKAVEKVLKKKKRPKDEEVSTIKRSKKREEQVEVKPKKKKKVEAAEEPIKKKKKKSKDVDDVKIKKIAKSKRPS